MSRTARFARFAHPTRATALYLWLLFTIVFTVANDQFLTGTT
jgi:hypothetical protein